MVLLLVSVLFKLTESLLFISIVHIINPSIFHSLCTQVIIRTKENYIDVAGMAAKLSNRTALPTSFLQAHPYIALHFVLSFISVSFLLIKLYPCNWAISASPTLGCSIKILHDIYIYMSVCRFVYDYGKPIQKIPYVKMCRRNYVIQTRAWSKSVLRV